MIARFNGYEEKIGQVDFSISSMGLNERNIKFCIELVIMV